MSKKNKDVFSKKFRKFISDSVNKILAFCDLPSYTYNINFINEEPHKYVEDGYSSGEIDAEIEVLPEYQNFNLSVFKGLLNIFNKGDFNRVRDILCHEIGHI